MDFAYGNDAEYWHDKYQQLVDSLDKLYEVFCETEPLYWEQLPIDHNGKPIKLDEYRYTCSNGKATRWHIVAYHSGNDYDVIGCFGETYKPFKGCELYSTPESFQTIIESVANFCVDYVDPGPEQLKPFVEMCERLAKSYR